MAARPEPLPPGGLAKLAPGSSCAYFFDVDGTLLEIKPRPEDVISDEDLRLLLVALAAVAGGALALVSGRMVDDIDRIFAPLAFPAAGLHGAEIRFPDGSRTCAESAVMDEARPKLRDFVAAHPGARLEDKGATLAIHFRQRPELEGEVRAFLAGFAQGGLAVQEGKLVAELKQGQYNKGAAIAALLEAPPFLGRRPVFIGDDLTDEKGFRLVNEKGGLSVRVGPPENATEARLRLNDPAELRRELGALVAVC
ncbi:trehalose-phosphatase [Methylocapsa polymorpha]|uniref:Trehalose 6-phosphate phosphatase n=1 Tax=Methylocapsa polymorpha TaxID=3080828 RepID=A0ABZ0HR31_9HYPH|nr:trehalose-phosphatase [Methylocapsa sp. RX1]